MTDRRQIMGHSLLVVLAVMLAVLVVSVLKPFSRSEQASNPGPVVTETVPVQEVGAKAPQDTDGEYIWEGIM
jgi:hypothetical protein